MPDKLEPTSPVPLYHQLEHLLARRIAQGRRGDVLPGEAELAMEFGVSRGTVRHALDRLAQRGLIVRHTGRRSVVGAPSLEIALQRPYQFSAAWNAGDGATSFFVLRIGLVDTPPHVAQQLKIAPNVPTVELVRLYHSGDHPLLIATSHLPAGLLGSLHSTDLSETSVHGLFARLGVHLSFATEQIRAVALDGWQADCFRLPMGAPALALARVTWSDTVPVEHTSLLGPADRVFLSGAMPWTASPVLEGAERHSGGPEPLL